MRKFLFRSACIVVVLLFAPAVARGQNTSFGTSVQMLVGQTPMRVTLDTDHFYRATVVLNRSYCAEASGSETELNSTTADLKVFRFDQATLLGSEGNLIEPKDNNASRICFIAPQSEDVFIKLSSKPPGDNHEYTMRFVETTLWANWYFVGGDYSSYTLLRNTTNTALKVDIRWFDFTGAPGPVKLLQDIPANGVLFIDARTAMACPFPTPCASTAGSVQVAHAGSPEAIVGSQTTLSSSTGLSFDTLLFQRRAW